MYAAAFGHREIVLLILAAFKQLHHVAVQGQRNGQGLTACQLAEKNGHEDVAALLKVESQAFGRPAAGPLVFVPTNPLDLDRPPTPTETTTIKSSLRRLKKTERSNTVPPLSDPTAPLQPTCENGPCCGEPLATDFRSPCCKETDGPCCSKSFTTLSRRTPCKEADDLCSNRSLVTTSRRTRCKEADNPCSNRSLATASQRARCKEGASLPSGKLRTIKGPRVSGSGFKPEVDIEPKVAEAIIASASVVVRTAVSKSSLTEDTDSKDSVTRGLSIARCRFKKPINITSDTAVEDTQNKWARDKETGENTRKDPGGESQDIAISQNKDIRNEAGKSQNTTNIDKINKLQSETEPVLVSAPDAVEKEVLEELMRDFIISCSPGSGNEADTESLMECEGSPREDINSRMSGPNSRKMTLSSVPLTVAALTSPNEFMPKIDLSSSTRSLNRSIQHLVQEDTEIRPGQRPPTPARPSLPTLLPGPRLLDISLNASLSSTKSEGRYAPPSRRVTFSSFPRSSSEPRSLTASPRPHQNPDNDYDDDDSDELSSDVLDSSTRSEGWDHLRGARGRGPAFPTGSVSHVVTLPPINPAKYTEASNRGREGIRGRGSGMSSHGENVLNVAKKTLEQLETVLAPSETSSLSRVIPRTRATHQIHLET